MVHVCFQLVRHYLPWVVVAGRQGVVLARLFWGYLHAFRYASIARRNVYLRRGCFEELSFGSLFWRVVDFQCSLYSLPAVVDYGSLVFPRPRYERKVVTFAVANRRRVRYVFQLGYGDHG